MGTFNLAVTILEYTVWIDHQLSKCNKADSLFAVNWNKNNSA